MSLKFLKIMKNFHHETKCVWYLLIILKYLWPLIFVAFIFVDFYACDVTGLLLELLQDNFCSKKFDFYEIHVIHEVNEIHTY